jgi:hypothetical protein
MGAVRLKWNFWKQPGFEWPSHGDKKAGLKYLGEHELVEFDEWVKRDHWSASEAVALSFGLDPKKAITSDGQFTAPKDSIVATHLLQLRDRITADQEASRLPDRMRPSFYLGWARYNHVDYPNLLEEALERREQDLLQTTMHTSDSLAEIHKRWASRPYWTADEAVALSQGGSPEDFWVTLKDYYRWRFYARQREYFLSAFPEPVRPSVCLAWAKQNGIDFPADIHEAVARYEQDVMDLMPRYDQLKERFEEREREITSLRYSIEKGNMELHKLRLELAAATKTQAKPGRDIKDLEPRALNSIFTLLYGLAKFHYEYVDPNRKSNAAKRIVGDLIQVDVKIDDGTVLKWLREAANECSESWSQPKG